MKLEQNDNYIYKYTYIALPSTSQGWIKIHKVKVKI